MKKSLRIVPLAVLLAFAKSSATWADDLPDFSSGLTPRVMIIFDTSSSMKTTPASRYDDRYATDDHRRDAAGNQVGECRNKLCLGKKAMYETLPAFSSLVENGLAGYFQYQYVKTGTGAGFNVYCTYQVLSDPGEDRSYMTYTDYGNGPLTCPSFTPSLMYACSASPQCTKTSTVTKGWNNFNAYSASTAGGTLNSSTYSTSGYTGILRDIEWNGLWSVPAKPDGTCPTPKVFGSSYVETGPGVTAMHGDIGCSASNPCGMYYSDSYSTNYNETVASYSNKGASYASGGSTYTLVGTTTRSLSYYTTLACNSIGTSWRDSTNANWGCNGASGPCDIVATGSTVVGLSDIVLYQSKGSSIVQYGITYSLVESGTEEAQDGGETAGLLEERIYNESDCKSKTGYTGSWGCTAAKPCDLSRKMVRHTHGEIPKIFCQYDRTWYRYRPTVGSYNRCNVNNTVYNYIHQVVGGTVCRYHRYIYRFWVPYYLYNYKSPGGEVSTYVSKTYESPTNLCADGTYDRVTGFSRPPGQPAACPPAMTGCDGLTNRLCMLSWYSWLNQGQYSSMQSGRLSSCTAPDRPSPAAAPYVDQPNPDLYRSNWCWSWPATINTGGSGLRADYYQPGVANPPLGSNESASPYLPFKSQGWARVPDGTKNSDGTPYAGGNAARSFIPIGSNNVESIKSAMLAYDGATNPTGLNTTSYGSDYTPLYGSLMNARDYLKSVMAADVDSTCRKYYVLLVTDGAEQTPANYGVTDLRAAVKALKDIGIPTYVVGFGDFADPDHAVDQMAQEAGTAFDKAALDQGVLRYSQNGVALSAMNGPGLRAALEGVFSAITHGTYTRSKPILNQAGNRIYAGYFSKMSASREWMGHLDAFDLAGIQLTPAWKYSDKIDAQASRSLYTTLYPTPGLAKRVAFSSAALAADDEAALHHDMLMGDPSGCSSTLDCRNAIDFLRNAGLGTKPAEKFDSGAPRLSRASDIYHSIPVVVGKPPFSEAWAGKDAAHRAAYKAFAARSREARVYVGANDGMVHAIREGTGQNADGSEAWGYVPAAALPLVAANRQSHTFSVDGNFGVSDLCASGCDDANNWRTVLIGSMRQGGRSFFALDVTNPDEPRPLWDFRSDGNLGETWSAPSIARVSIQDGAIVKNAWAAFVGGGFDRSTLDNGVGNSFFVLDAVTGKVLENSAGSTTERQAKFKVEYGAGLPKNNVTGRPAVYRVDDGPDATGVYFGDTQGRLHRMSVVSTTVKDWAPTTFFDPSSTVCALNIAAKPTPIISVATFGSVGTLPLPTASSPPPIHGRPLLALDDKGRLVLFAGTGDTANPLSTNDVNYFYAVREARAAGSCGTPMWVKKFAPGEKIVSDPSLVGQAVIVASYTPPAPGLGCKMLGDSTLYGFDAATGGPRAIFKDGNTTVSQVKLGNKGIVSDLMVFDGKLIFNTSNSPQTPTVMELAVSKAYLLKGWRRVR